VGKQASNNGPVDEGDVVVVEQPRPEISGEEFKEFYELLKTLRADEACQITFTSPNPEFNDVPDEVVEVKDLWTEWCVKEFRGDSLLRCMRDAVRAREKWYADREAKKIKLPWQT